MRYALVCFLLAACGAEAPASPPLADVPPSDGSVANDRTSPLCTPGRTKPCPCANGVTGAQSCQSDGTYSACVCFDASVLADVTDASNAEVALRDAPTDAPVDADPRCMNEPGVVFCTIIGACADLQRSARACGRDRKSVV